MRPTWSNIANHSIIRIRDVFVARLVILDSKSTFQEHLISIQNLNCSWIFVQEQQNIVGVISVEELREYSHLDRQSLKDICLNVANTSLHSPLHQTIELLSESTPVAVVYHQGKALGYVDQNTPKYALHRAQLSEKSSHSLLSLPWVSEISKISTELGIPVYLIGGCVRDWLLNQSNMDIDFAVEGSAIDLAENLADEFGGHVDHFSNFGGAHWTINGETIDLTMCRHEVYPTFASLPQVQPSHISDDLGRRDFAINAMAISIFKPTLGLLIDPFDGRGDIDDQKLRILHVLSWLQDPTRIFRASRYSARLDFTLEPHALSYLHTCIKTITPGTELTLTRIGIEFNKMLDEPDINKCFHCLNSWGVTANWFPFWQNLQFPQSCNLSYSPTSAEYKDLWWMILALAIPPTLREQYTQLIGIRANALKLLTKLQKDLPNIVLGLSAISTDDLDFEVRVGVLLQESTPIHWMISIHLQPEITFLIEWWVSTGRHRQRQTTGEDILQMGIPKGPMIGTLLQTAQTVAWQGGDQNLERLEVQKIWKQLSNKTKDVSGNP